MIIGHDHLGYGHPLYPIKAVISTAVQGSCFGAFFDVFAPFDKTLPKIRRALQSGKYSVFRGHCEYNKDHTLIPLDKLKRMLPKCERLAKDFPNVRIYISHTCEYYSKNKKDIQTRVNLIRKLAPSCIPINSPMGGATLPGVLNEWHATPENHSTITIQHAGDFISTDGMSCVDMEIPAFLERNKAAGAIFLWGSRYNLREGKDPQPAPPSRKAFPDIKYISSIARLMLPKGPVPTMLELEYGPLLKPDLFKTHAEDAEGVQPRDNKPCLIHHTKEKFAEILTMHGVSLGRFPFFDEFSAGGYRYYSGLPSGVGLYGYELERKALNKSGFEYVVLRVGSTNYGPIHPSFRGPWFPKK